MKRLPKLVVITFMSLSLCGSVRAQQTAPTGLALEIVYYEGAPPAYSEVRAANARAGGAWYARFRGISSWQPPADSLPVRAVNIVSRMEGDAVRINVSVFVGVRFHDRELPVASYLVRESEQISVRELPQHGVEAFRIKVVRIAPSAVSPPPVDNRIKAIEVLGLTPNNSTTPSYKLSLRNASNKNILALEINVYNRGRRRSTTQPQGKQGAPLIEAGAIFETNVPDTNPPRLASGGDAPEAYSNQTIVLSSAVFEDGSYEGEALPAAEIRARDKGRKIQIARVITLLQNALKALSGAADSTTAQLKAQVSALNEEVDPALLDELMVEFPTLNANARNDLKVSMEVALHRVKIDLLNELEAATRATDANALQAWLSNAKEKYEKWLARL